jgi:tetratricopeptide (TPR) repeat protein
MEQQHQLVEELRAAIEQSRRLYLSDNALFLAERLFADFPACESLLLLAQAYRDAGDAPTALRLLQQYTPFTSLPTTCIAVTTSHHQQHQHSGARWDGTVTLELVYLHGVIAAACGQPQQCAACMAHIAASARANPDSVPPGLHAAALYWDGAARGAMDAQQAPALGGRQPSRAALSLRGAFEADGTLFAAAEAAVSRHNVIGDILSAPSALAPQRFPAASAYLWPLAQATHAVRGARHLDGALALLSGPDAVLHGAGGYAHELLGEALLDAGRTQDAARELQAALRCEPWRVNTPMVVLLSTALWHGRNEAALSALAQRVQEAAPGSPYALCVVGNWHSLRRDKRTAAAFFDRAAQQAPTYAYACTLRGHELLALDDVAGAEASFREALRRDPRHFRALAGLGDLYMRVEDDERARQYMREALRVGPRNPTIISRLAATHHRPTADLHDLETALRLYDEALALAPQMPMLKHQRAAVLMRLGESEKAYDVLGQLRQQCPDEPTVAMTMARCAYNMGQPGEALRLFQVASDLDPRRAGSLRPIIDRLAMGQPLSED